MKEPPTKIRMWRLELGMSLGDLADALGLSATFVGLIERGIEKMPLARCPAWAEVLGIDVNELTQEVRRMRARMDAGRFLEEHGDFFDVIEKQKDTGARR